jgi:hypothetical protein
LESREKKEMPFSTNDNINNAAAATAAGFIYLFYSLQGRSSDNRDAESDGDCSPCLPDFAQTE